MNSKNFLKSKTIWFNLLAILVILVNALCENNEVLKPFFEPKIYNVVIAVLPVINLYLRSITEQKINFKVQKKGTK